MPDNLQTPVTGGEEELEKIESNKAIVNNLPEQVFADSGIVELLKEINPKYAGHNTAHLRSLLVKDDSLLNEFAVRILSNSTATNERLAQAYSNDPELHNAHKQKVKDFLYLHLTNDTVQGQSLKETLVGRTLDLKSSDISDFKPHKGFLPGYDSLIERESKKRGIDPDFVRAMIMQESGGDPDSVSHKGAIGLMQLMPGTAKDLGVDPNDPKDNIRGGIEYFAKQLNKYQDVALALAAYNAGPNRESIKKGEIPEIEETRNYIDKVLGNYESLKATKINYDLPLSEYRDLALKNKDKYKELGLITEEGTFAYDGEEGQKVFLNKILNDKDLHKELISDRYDEFQNKLANSNNTGAVDESDINELGKAWAVYDQFGSEGLTRFLNLRQHYQSGVPIEQQPQSVQEAIRYLKNTSKSGFKIPDYISAFYGSKSHPLGKLEYTPIMQSAELNEDVAKDLNNYSKFFYDEGSGFASFVDNIRKKEVTEERSFLDKAFDLLKNIGQEFIPKTKTLQTDESQRTSSITPGPVIMDEEQYYKEADVQTIIDQIDNGIDSILTRSLKFDIMREALKEDGMFSLNDLFRTIMANHDEYSEADGHPVYILDYKKADRKTRLAIDAIRADEEVGKTIFMNSDGNIVFDPTYMERLGNRPFARFLRRDQPAKVRVDEFGNVIDVIETSPHTESGSTLGRVLGVAAFETAKFLDNLVIKPAIEKAFLPWIETLRRNSEDITGEESEFLETVESWTRQGYRNVREKSLLDADVTSDLPSETAGDLLTIGTSWAVPMLEYLYVAGRLGDKGLKAPYEYIKQMSKARSAFMNESASMLLGNAEKTFFGSMAKKQYQYARAKAPVRSWGRYALGSANIEFLNSDEWSLVGTGMVDQAINYASELATGREADLDLQRKYALSDNFVRSALDILTYESVGLLADNLLGLLGVGAFSLKSTRKGLKYDPKIKDFERVKEHLFTSDSRRFIYNMFNGLQDAPIGTISESLANKTTGRAFIFNPENATTLADAVTGFSDNAGYIFRDAKKIIRDNIKHYDEKFGGKIQYSTTEIEDRVNSIYSDFMDKTARNIKSVLENTSDDDLLTLKIANLLDGQAPSVKGTVPYYKEGDAFHVMTVAEAEELAAQSNRYIVKPYQGSDKFARVFEVEDGLWTTELANRIRNLYQDETVDDIIQRHIKAKGMKSGNVGRTQDELEQIQEIESAIRGVYGQEVNINGKRGYVLDVTEDGFVVRDVDGTLHTNVKIAELDDVSFSVTGKSQFYEEMGDTVKGGTASPTGNGVVQETIEMGKRRSPVTYPNLDIRAQNYLSELENTRAPLILTEELRQIAKANGVDVGITDNPTQVINRLRNKGISDNLRKTLEKIETAGRLAKRFKEEQKASIVKRAPETDKVFKASGLRSPFMKQLNKYAGYVKESKGEARKFAKLLGVDNTDGYKIFGKNVADIVKWNPKKVGNGKLRTNTIVIHNGNGVDEYFISTKPVTSTDTPTVWVKDDTGTLRFHDKWKRIQPNYTLNEDGTLPIFKAVDIDGETWYTRAEPGERGVFLNIQRPIKDIEPDEATIMSKGIDAIEREFNGQQHFRLINEGQQTVNPKLLKETPTKIYNSKSTVKTPKRTTIESSEMEREAVNAVAEYISQAGLGKGVAYALAGSLVDNFIGTVPNPDEDGFQLGLFSLAGALMGNRRIRTKVSSVFNGYAKKPIKDLFDKSYSAHYEAEKVIKQRKEALKYDITYDPLNEKSKDMSERFVEAIKNTSSATRNAWDDLKNHEYVTSSFTFLRNIGSETGMRFLKALQGMNLTINEISSSAPRKFKAAMRQMEGVDSSGDVYSRFINEDGPNMVRRIFPDQVFDEGLAKDNFDLAFFRIMNSGAQMTEEGFQSTPTPNIQRMYESSKGEQYRRLDEALMRDPQFNAFVEAHRDFFTRVMDRWMSQVNGRIDRIFSALPDETRDPFRTLLDSEQSYGLWKGTLDEQKKKLVTDLYKENSNIRRLVDLHNTKTKFTNLDRKYFPQIVSKTRTESAFRRFVLENGLENVHQDRQREAFNEHMVKVMYDLNTDESARKTLMKYDPDSGEYKSKPYNSKDRARADLSSISDYLMATRSERDFEIARRIENNPDEFIEKRVETLFDKNGDPVRNKQGKIVTEEKYILTQPDDLDINIYELEIGNFSNNFSEFRDLYDDLMNNAIIRNSNFLERPRIKYLPHEILEVDMERVRKIYSTDVGRRIHNAEHNMFDVTELEAEYLNPIIKHASEELGYDDKTISSYKDRLVSIYNVMNNTINKSGNDLRKEAKFRTTVDLFKNAMFARFGYGFGWYNLLEWAVVGPNISSFSSVYNTAKLFINNKEALGNVEEFMNAFDIVRREIGSVNPDFERYGLLSDSETLNFYSNMATKAANFAADFSFSKTIGGKLFGWDVNNWGMARLLTDNFIGSNMVSSSINAMAALSEARYLGRLARELENVADGPRIIQRDGKRFTYGDVKRKLGQLGITDENYERWINNIERTDEIWNSLRGESDLNFAEIAKDELPDHVLDVFTIMQTATENFHGTNKLYRPGGWNSPMGKALSTYSTYPFNFSLQAVQRRIRQPIGDWWRDHGARIGLDKNNITVMKMLYNLSQGNIQALRNMGLDDMAIESIPVDAYRSVLKLLGTTMGVSVASYATIDAVNDMLVYPINEVTGQEQWKRLRRRTVLNPGAPKEDQITWADIDENFGLDTFMNIGHYMLGTMARGSAFGRYGDLILQQGQLSRTGMLGFTPMTSMVDQTFRDVLSITSGPVTDYPKEMSNTAMKFFINNTPVLGSNVFGELRKGIYEQVRLRDPRIRFVDESTQTEIKIEDITTALD